MRRKRFLAAVTATLALALAPAGAVADTSVAPTSVAFPSQVSGTSSGPITVTLTKDCMGADAVQCFALMMPASFNPSISVTPPFSQTNNCPATLSASILQTSASCAINVTFSPTAPGTVSGTLTTGMGGPTVALGGIATAAPATPTPVLTKKCKKKKKKQGAAAKKKCGKKKNGK